MNTFFRQKLTNKTIDLLEKVEDRKTRGRRGRLFNFRVTDYFGYNKSACVNYTRNYSSDHCHPRGGLYMGNNRYDHIWWNVQLADRIFLILESCDRS